MANEGPGTIASSERMDQRDTMHKRKAYSDSDRSKTKTEKRKKEETTKLQKRQGNVVIGSIELGQTGKST